jgi:hypothetical protein
MKKKTKSSSSPNKASAAKEDLRRRREPPFSLYKESSEPNFPEGLASVINLLKGRKNIAVLSGAGMSVSCGIPDFRTKGSGLYSILDTEVRCCFVFRVVLFSGMWDVGCVVLCSETRFKSMAGLQRARNMLSQQISHDILHCTRLRKPIGMV